VVSVASWMASVQLLEQRVALRTPSTFALFAVALLLVCMYFGARPPSERADRPRLRSPTNAAAIVLIGMVSLRTDGLFGALGKDGTFLHQSVYVGPAELVRQGGWLYWDVPSQYGFLSILTLVLLPPGRPGSRCIP